MPLAYRYNGLIESLMQAQVKQRVDYLIATHNALSVPPPPQTSC